jgi:hypothetical protein
MKTTQSYMVAEKDSDKNDTVRKLREQTFMVAVAAVVSVDRAVRRLQLL